MISIERVTPKNLINQLKLEKFQVGVIQAKYANKVIQVLKGTNTLPVDCIFLKRIRKNKEEQANKPVCVEVLLYLTEQKQKYQNQVQQALRQAFDQNIIKEITTVEIPRYAPSSKKDFQIWSKYWPCNYIEPECIKEVPHSKEQIQTIQQLYQKFIEQQKNRDYILFSPTQYLFNCECQGQEYSCHNENPINHPIMILAEGWPQTQKFKIKQNEYYYFTGLWMLIKTEQLCGMCAMALVHSRVERIYFEEKSIPQESILEILHCLKLNHKIDLFKVKKIQKEQQV